MTRDVSYAARRLRKQPIMLLLMVTSLGVGVGVNITLYSVVHRVLSADWLQAREPEQRGIL